MFFTGDLQSGISLALHEKKVVVCFVTGRRYLLKQESNVRNTDSGRRGGREYRVGEGLPYG